MPNARKAEARLPPARLPETQPGELRFPRSTSLRVRELRALDERLARHQEYQRADLDRKRRLVVRMRLPFRISVVVSSGVGGVLLWFGLQLFLGALLGLLGDAGAGAGGWGALLAGFGGLVAGVLAALFAGNAALHLRLYGAVLGELEQAAARGGEPRSLLAALDEAQTSPGSTGPPRTSSARVAVRITDLLASRADVARVDAHLEQITTMRDLGAEQRRERLLRQVPAMRSGALGLVVAVGMFAPGFVLGGLGPVWLVLLRVLGIAALALLGYLAWSSWRFAALLEIALFEADAAFHEERAVRPLTSLGVAPGALSATAP